MKKHSQFKPEQKVRAVLLVLAGEKSAAQICRELRIGENLLSRWKNRFLEQAGSVLKKNRPLLQTTRVSSDSSDSSVA